MEEALFLGTGTSLDIGHVDEQDYEYVGRFPAHVWYAGYLAASSASCH
jgi:hypothetical protein